LSLTTAFDINLDSDIKSTIYHPGTPFKIRFKSRSTPAKETDDICSEALRRNLAVKEDNDGNEEPIASLTWHGWDWFVNAVIWWYGGYKSEEEFVRANFATHQAIIDRIDQYHINDPQDDLARIYKAIRSQQHVLGITLVVRVW
jgi:hypothetical protein